MRKISASWSTTVIIRISSFQTRHNLNKNTKSFSVSTVHCVSSCTIRNPRNSKVLQNSGGFFRGGRCIYHFLSRIVVSVICEGNFTPEICITENCCTHKRRRGSMQDFDQQVKAHPCPVRQKFARLESPQHTPMVWWARNCTNCDSISTKRNSRYGT